MKQIATKELRILTDDHDTGKWIELINTISKSLNINIEIYENSSSTRLSSGGWHEIIANGQSVLLAILPVIAFYIGKGKRVKIKMEEKELEMEGFSKSEVQDLLKQLNQTGNADKDK